MGCLKHDHPHDDSQRRVARLQGYDVISDFSRGSGACRGVRLVRYRGKWAVTGKDAAGKQWRTSLRTSDREIAQRRFKDFRVETPGDTVGDAVESYLQEKRKSGARSCASMSTAWRALAPYFSHLRPDQITRDVCRDYADRRRRAGVSDGTIIKDLGVLKAAIRWAGKAQGATFEFPHAPPPRERYITRDEHQRLVDACDLPHIRLFVILAWATAGRHSAILELEWSQIDFHREQIRLAKGSGRRKGRATVPMTQQAKEALQAACEVRTCESVVEYGGHAIKSVKKAFEAACVKAGLADVTPHVLRHSAAVAMVEDGVRLEVVGQFLGHTDPKVTYRVYARFSPTHLKRAIRALE